MKRPAAALIRVMKEKGLTLALTESMTCGMAAYKLSNCVGASEVLMGSLVCYDADVKNKLLKIPKSVVEKYTAESRRVTELLTRNLKKLIKADVYAAITGLASEGGSETKQKPVGTVFFSMIINDHMYSFRKQYAGTPMEIKSKSCNTLFELILKHL